MTVQRTSYGTLNTSDVEYYRNLMVQYPDSYTTYPYTCHCCRRELVGGDRFCNLINASDSMRNLWCRDCAQGFERAAGY